MADTSKKPVGRPRKTPEIHNKQLNAFSLISEISFSVPDTVEKEASIYGEKYITWGEHYPTVRTINPEFYSEIASKCPTLSAIISRRQDYLMGNEIVYNTQYVEDKWNDIIYKLFLDIQTYGGFALQVGWNGLHYEIEYIKIKNLRTNKDFTKFYYLEDWFKSDKNTFITFDAFTGKHSRKPQILFYKEPNTGHYPSPLYEAALTACDTQIRIQDFNNNTVANNFNVSGYLTVPVSNPTDEEINLLEMSLAAKFGGNRNAAKFFALTYDPNTANGARPELQRLNADSGFVDQYTTIDTNTKDKIYQTMKAIPALFGDVTAATGFNTQEFKESFKQENTYITRLQKIVSRVFDRLYGEASISFIPFIDAEEAQLDAKQVMEIVANPNLTETQKIGILKLTMKLSDEDIDLIFNTVDNVQQSVSEETSQD